jgi:hypothetical protein
LIGSNIQVIGAKAFDGCKMFSVVFENGTSLKEIRAEAFSECSGLTEFKLPESVEIIGARCFVLSPGAIFIPSQSRNPLFELHQKV